MYHTLDNRTDKEVGSVFPQAECLSQIDAHRLTSDQFPAFVPSLKFELAKKAKLTDVVSQGAISAMGFLISSRFKEIIDRLSQPNLKTFPATIEVQNRIENYFWLHIRSIDVSEMVDYDSSSFYYTDCEFRQDAIAINSYSHYKSLKNEKGIMWGVGMDKIKLSDKFDPNLEIFHLSPFDRTVYISKRLKNLIIDHNLTGMEIKKADNLF